MEGRLKYLIVPKKNSELLLLIRDNVAFHCVAPGSGSRIRTVDILLKKGSDVTRQRDLALVRMVYKQPIERTYVDIRIKPIIEDKRILEREYEAICKGVKKDGKSFTIKIGPMRARFFKMR